MPGIRFGGVTTCDSQDEFLPIYLSLSLGDIDVIVDVFGTTALGPEASIANTVSI